MNTKQTRFVKPTVNSRERLLRQFESLRHQAHVRYQKQELKADPARMYAVEKENVPRGLRRERSLNEKRFVFNPAWFTGLRPNFWRGYIETTLIMRGVGEARAKRLAALNPLVKGQ